MKKTIIALVLFAGILLGSPLHAQTYAIDNPNVFSMTIPAPATYGVQYYDITGKPVFVPSVAFSANQVLASPSSGTGNAQLRALTTADLPGALANFTFAYAGTAGATFTLPAASDTLAGLGTTQTFTAPQTFTNTLTLGGGLPSHFYNNYATAGQTPGATTRTVITGTQLHIPAGALQVGTVLHWQFDMTKTAAGTASSTIDIAFGTLGTTGDTAQVSFTKPAGTAAGDEGTVIIEAVVKTNSASGVVLGNFTMTHNLSATGHMTIPTCSVETGASDAITINQASAVAYNL
jgi:hypothetical protein